MRYLQQKYGILFIYNNVSGYDIKIEDLIRNNFLKVDFKVIIKD